jgi:acyl carrier protein
MKVEHADIVDLIRDAKTMVQLDELSFEDDLRDRGADSLDLMNILLAIQEKYGVEIPDSELDNLSSVAAMCTFVNQNIQ